MAFFQAIFKIATNENCPLYQTGDEFKLSGNALFLPPDKPVCLILAGDITKILISTKQPDRIIQNDPKDLIKCSGCSGFVYLSFEEDKKKLFAEIVERTAHEVDAIAGMLRNFSMFESLSEIDIREIVSLLRVIKVRMGDTIIKKGEPGKNLFIIVSGKVEVLGDDNICIAHLEKGDVFGEMSLLSGEPVGASIRVIEPGTILYIKGRDFRNMLNKYPSLHLYFARILARRLTNTNIARSQEFSSGMIGKISEITPSELFQTLNINQKTGRLIFDISKGPAEVVFKNGNLIRARYANKEGREAFFEILKETDGRFKYYSNISVEDSTSQDIGDFMYLLMEGLRRIDEETEQKTGSRDA